MTKHECKAGKWNVHIVIELNALHKPHNFVIRKQSQLVFPLSILSSSCKVPEA